MAIKYLDVKRIRGSSTDTVTALSKTWLFDDAEAEEDNTTTWQVSGGDINSSTSGAYDSGSFNNQSVPRAYVELDADITDKNFTWDIDFSEDPNHTGNNYGGFFVLSNYADVRYGQGSGDAIHVMFSMLGSSNEKGRRLNMNHQADSTTRAGATADGIVDQILTDETIYYLRVKRTNPTTVVTTIHSSDANRTAGIVLGDGTNTMTIPSTLNSLDRISVAYGEDSGANGNMFYLKVYKMTLLVQTITDEKATLLTPAMKAATFDGSDDKAGTSTISQALTDNWAMGGWVYNTGSGSEQIFETIGYALYVSRNATANKFRIEGSGLQIYSTTALANDTWYHVIANCVSNAVTLYINGVASNDTGVGSYDNTQTTDGGTVTKIWVGAEGSGNQMYWTGSFSDLAVFSRNLTTGEITSLSGGARVSNTIVDSAVIANWTFDSDFTSRIGSSDMNLITTSSPTAGNTVGTLPLAAYSDLPTNTLFEETDTRTIYGLESAEWKQWYPVPLRAVIAGGTQSDLTAGNRIEYFSISTRGDATTWGANLTVARAGIGSGQCNNDLRAVFVGGET